MEILMILGGFGQQKQSQFKAKTNPILFSPPDLLWELKKQSQFRKGTNGLKYLLKKGLR
jgi:hypothetical protein